MNKILLAGVPSRELDALKRGLDSLDYEVRAVGSIPGVWDALVNDKFDALVVDTCAASRRFDPWRLSARMRSTTDTPLILLIRSDHNEDRVAGFRLGARHCLTLPVTGPELAACLDMTVHEGKERTKGESRAIPEGYLDGELEIDLAHYEIRRGEQVFTITQRELPLLRRLIRENGKVVSAQELCRILWGRAAWPAKRALLMIYIWKLRRKIEADPQRPRYLLSRRGIGYSFVPRVSAPVPASLNA